MTFVRFRLAILAGFLCLVGAVLGSSLFVVSRNQARQVESDLRQQLEITRAVFDFSLQRRWSQMTDSVRILGADFAFKKTLATRDPGTIESNAQSLRERLGADALWVLDEKGRLMADTTGLLKPGAAPNLPIVKAALRGDPGSALDILMERPYQLAAAPISAPDPIGCLMAGFALDDKAALELKQLTGAEVSFAAGGRILASTLGPRERESLQQGLGALKPGNVSRLGSGAKEQSLVLSSPLSPAIMAYIQRSWNEAMEPVRRQNRLLVLISLAGLAITAMAGHLIAVGVTASIERLVETTKALNEELSQVNRFQSEFFSMVAHDVANPMGAVHGYAEMLQDQLKDPENQRLLEALRKAVEAMQFLISDLVDFASIETGKLRVNPQPLDLLPVLREIESRTAILAKKKGIAFQALLPAALPLVKGDGRRLSQVLQNLCSNALNYTKPKGRVSLKAEAAPGAVQVGIQDSGIGIAPSDLPKIFNRFFQAENARKLRGAGLGLGLKITREIVEAHGGTIKVTSELGRGSLFLVTLPLDKSNL